MTILEFVNKYENTDERLRAKFLEENLEVTKYVPYNKKLVLAESIAKTTTVDNEKNLKLSSPARYLLFVRCLIENWTNLTVETNNFLDEYDALKSSGLLDDILDNNYISTSEVDEFNNLIKMCVDDLMENNFSMQKYVQNGVERISFIINSVFETGSDAIFELLKNSNMKSDDINKLIDKFKKE